jgi:archaellum component FlaG (FlaF/FlaG flagellin family)
MTCTCEICGKKIVGGSHKLSRHQQSKKCQSFKVKKPPSMSPCQCDVCGRTYVKCNTKRHLASKRCQAEALKAKEKEILELKAENTKLKKRPTQTTIINNNNNNIINNIIMTRTSLDDVLTLQAIRNVYTNNDFADKGAGAARAIFEILNNKDKKRYICTDPARNICRYIDMKGKKIKDVKNSKLWKVIKGPVKKVVKEKRKELSESYPDHVDRWTDYAKPIINADVTPPPGFRGKAIEETDCL